MCGKDLWVCVLFVHGVISRMEWNYYDLWDDDVVYLKVQSQQGDVHYAIYYWQWQIICACINLNWCELLLVVIFMWLHVRRSTGERRTIVNSLILVPINLFKLNWPWQDNYIIGYMDSSHSRQTPRASSTPRDELTTRCGDANSATNNNSSGGKSLVLVDSSKKNII